MFKLYDQVAQTVNGTVLFSLQFVFCGIRRMRYYIGHISQTSLPSRDGKHILKKGNILSSYSICKAAGNELKGLLNFLRLLLKHSQEYMRET